MVHFLCVPPLLIHKNLQVFEWGCDTLKEGNSSNRNSTEIVAEKLMNLSTRPKKIRFKSIHMNRAKGFYWYIT